MSTTFNPSLHGLRGIAAFSVFLFHWDSFFPAAGKALPVYPIQGVEWSLAMLISFGWLGVPLFFVLSGYLLGGQLKQQSMSAGRLMHFWKRRALRIYPAVWVQLPILLVAASFIPGITSTYPQGADLLRNILLWINMPPWMTSPMNGVWWTLPIELSFYLFLPLLVLIQRKIGWVATYLGCVLCAFTWRWGIIALNDADFYVPYLGWLDMLPGSISSFAAGFAITFIDFKWSKRQWLAATLGTIAVFLLLLHVLLVHIDVYWSGHWLLVVWNSCISLTIAGIIYCAIHPQATGRWLGTAPLVWLGEISFGLYLWHLPVLLALLKLTELANTATGSFLALLIGLTLTLPLSAASYYWIERPIMGWGKRKATL